MVEVVYEWARGMSFNRITDLTDVMEGTIVRVITRLDETCREVKNAARIIGDPVLFQKMGTCQELIKRYASEVSPLSTGNAGRVIDMAHASSTLRDYADSIFNTGISATARACTYKAEHVSNDAGVHALAWDCWCCSGSFREAGGLVADRPNDKGNTGPKR
jgi:hypothetical protein